MTWKCALAEVAAGGGKAVVLDHPGLDRAAAENVPPPVLALQMARERVARGAPAT